MQNTRRSRSPPYSHLILMSCLICTDISSHSNHVPVLGCQTQVHKPYLAPISSRQRVLALLQSVWVPYGRISDLPEHTREDLEPQVLFVPQTVRPPLQHADLVVE